MKGISFGLTSGIITTLGLIVGLNEFTGSKLIIVGGILTIAIADAFSDALGIHISEESEKGKSDKDVWTSTITTFLSKIIFASTFIVPILLFEKNISIWISILWGFLGLIILNYFIAKEKGKNPLQVIGEHLLIAIIVLIIVHFIGKWIAIIFI